MVHAESTVPTELLQRWLEDPVSMLDDAVFWVSAGTKEHWQWSLMYSQVYEKCYTYWGPRLEADHLKATLKKESEQARREARRVPASLAKLLESLASDKPNVVLFYVTKGEEKEEKTGIIGAGLIVGCEFDFLNLFWPEERNERKVKFSFRYKMRILWLHESVLLGDWHGDEELTELLKNYVFSGLQPVEKEEVIKRLREALRMRFSRSPPLTYYSWQDRLNVSELNEKLKEKGLLFSEKLLHRLTAALKSGKHVILVGPPGTGKTILIRTLAETYNVPLVEKTATSDWSRIDVVGGPVFVGGEVVWKCGALLEALARCYENSGYGAILLIDEINRANLDKAFGEFFTIFGGSDPDEWRIPDSLIKEMMTYHERNKVDQYCEFLLRIYANHRELKVPRSFRVIATMNLYDRRYLFTLGYALLRRFAVIEIENPDDDELLQVLSERCKNSEIVKLTFDLYEKLRSANLELGIAVLIDVARLASELVNQGLAEKEAFDNAVAMMVLPQLEGLPPSALENCKTVFEELKLQTSLRTFDSFFGRELREFSELGR